MYLSKRLHNGVQKIGIAGLIAGALLTGSVALADIVSGLATTGLSNNVTITNLTIDKPADVAVGDVLIASIAIHDGNTVSVTPPTGWTLIRRTDNDTNIGIASYWKVAGASEPSNYSWSLSPQTRAAGGITRYSGVDTTNPIDVSAGNIGRGTVATTTSLTTSAGNARIIAVFALHVGGNTHAGAFFSTPTGMTEKYDVSKTAAGPTIASSDMTQATAGTADSKSSTIAGAQQRDWVSQQIALRMRLPAVEALVVGGGGGGVGLAGGAGGGGGVVYSPSHTVAVGNYAITVGAGGAGVGPSTTGNSGSDSAFDTLTAVGGGAGGQQQFNGINGGSGGGGGSDAGVMRFGGGGTPGQGNAGGSNGGGGGPEDYPSGGGGGAGAPGGDAFGTHGGDGGAGIAHSITGTSVVYGGGGGGVTNTGGGTGGQGGTGGGGAGGMGVNGGDGAPNTGGGGGAASNYNTGGSGGSGVVIISYPTGSMTATGGTITIAGGNTIHTFTSSGTFTVF